MAFLVSALTIKFCPFCQNRPSWLIWLIYWIKSRGINLRNRWNWVTFDFLGILVIHFGFVVLKLLKLVWGLAERSLVSAWAVKIILKFLRTIVLASSLDLANYLVSILSLWTKVEPGSLSWRIYSHFLEILMAFPIRFRPIMLSYIYN